MISDATTVMLEMWTFEMRSDVYVYKNDQVPHLYICTGLAL